MMKRVNIVLVFTLILFAGIPAYADNFDVNVSAGLGYLSGNTLSQDRNYSYPNPGPGFEPIYYSHKKREKFPLDVYMGSFAADIKISKKFSVKAEVKKNITTDAGLMEKTDWGLFYHTDPVLGPDYVCPNCSDRKSKSETDLNAVITDANFRYNFFHRPYEINYGNGALDLYVGLGYVYQNFDYEFSDLKEYYPFGFASESGFPSSRYYPEDIGTYEVTYQMPYIELVLEETLGKFGLEISICFSPNVQVDDEYSEDEFTSNYLYSMNGFDAGDYLAENYMGVGYEGDCEGTAWFGSIEGLYNISNQWFAVFKYNHFSIKTDGEMTTRDYLIFINGSDFLHGDLELQQKIESKQHSYMFSVGRSF